jgi:5-methyltetrahydropteroyltriglutamate--homocysteine methyltransferase
VLGNYEGPHHTDIPPADIIDLVLKARPVAVSFEGANPRQIFEDLRLPSREEPVARCAGFDHELHRASRAGRIAHLPLRDLVCPQNVMAGTDCGFATFASFITVEPEITRAKLTAMAEGAWLAMAAVGPAECGFRGTADGVRLGVAGW